MDREAGRALAARWIDAWRSGDPAAVLALLHADAVVADPVAGKVRPGAVEAYVRDEIAAGHPGVHTWVSTVGVDSVAVVATLVDGGKQVDTLVLADDGLVVRAMRHR